MSRIFTGLGLTLASAVVLAGCSFSTDSAPQNGSSNADGGASGGSPGTSMPGDTSSGGTAPSGKLSFAPANVAPDASLTANGDWIFNSDTCGGTQVTIDTAKGEVSCDNQPKGSFSFQTITQPDQSYGSLTAALFVTRKLVIEPGMVIDVIGNRPLIIVALESASIQGTLRAVGDRNQAVAGGFDGPAANQTGNGPGGGQGANGGSQGGGGGSYCGAGGGNRSHTAKTYGNARNAPLLGGSAGGSEITLGSTGGGAMQIVAGLSIEVSVGGVINAPGGGGGSYSAGGGAGGAILIEAPQVSVFGTLAANGGGGGSGDGATNDGANGTASSDPAVGGLDPTGDSTGGSGSAGSVVLGQDAHQPVSRSQGGGGGGAGWIRINTKSGSAMIGASAVISPSLSTACATQGTSATH